MILWVKFSLKGGVVDLYRYGFYAGLIPTFPIGRIFKTAPRLAHEGVQRVLNQRENQNWLVGGRGDMFDSEKPDIRLEAVIDIFNQLDEELQDYLLSQAKWLLKLKKERVG